MEHDPPVDRAGRPRDVRLEARRARWVYRGQNRPPFAAVPGPGQISVWDFPRPPRIERESRRVEVSDQSRSLARSERALRVLETASPPTIYLPIEDVEMSLLAHVPGESICEWKGRAEYLLLEGRATLGAVAWRIPDPFAGYEPLAGCISFYAGRLHCRLGGEDVRAQPGSFYGGWITSELAGPFKGAPGSDDW